MRGVGCYYIFCKNTCVCEVNKLERRFYLVDAEVLPEVFLKVVKAKELLASGEVRSISAATRSVDLSRSAFYKYKDCIFDSENGREVVTVMATLRDETGALQSLLAGISAAGASIVTINQSTPENGAALVAVTIRTDTMQMTPEELTERLSRQRMVVGVHCGYNPICESILIENRNEGCIMAKIAILGFGTVGSGVYEVLCRNAAGVSRRAGEPVEVKYILDPKDFSAHPAANLFIKNFDTILEDPEIRVVVETIGGTRFAYPYVKACLESGRSVCTSNKEMVATYGAELLALAKAHNCAFLFEASVGGGTPIITPMHQCLAANVITEVEGIVNGTTNFMLTKMVRENLGFDEALKIAQELGYAETKDPGDDVDGRDACRKIAILSSLVCGHQIYPQNIPTRGIRDITVADVAAAERLNCVIKLIAWMKRGNDGSVAAGVEPCLVPRSHQLAGVDDVFNAVLVKGDMLGDVVFYGKGAGKLPTASAVVADVVDALKNGSKVHDSLFWQPAEPVEGMLTDPAPAAYYVRVEGIAPAVAEAIYGKGHVVEEHFDGCSYFVERADEKALAEAARKVEAVGGSVKLVLKRLPEEN